MATTEPRRSLTRNTCWHRTRRYLKRIELVIDPGAFDRFRDAAKDLNLANYDVTEVRRTLPASIRGRQRLYRGREFVLDLVEGRRIDLMVAEAAPTTLGRELCEGV